VPFGVTSRNSIGQPDLLPLACSNTFLSLSQLRLVLGSLARRLRFRSGPNLFAVVICKAATIACGPEASFIVCCGRKGFDPGLYRGQDFRRRQGGKYTTQCEGERPGNKMVPRGGGRRQPLDEDLTRSRQCPGQGG